MVRPGACGRDVPAGRLSARGPRPRGFSDTVAAVKLEAHETPIVADIVLKSYDCLSDGCGDISIVLAEVKQAYTEGLIHWSSEMSGLGWWGPLVITPAGQTGKWSPLPGERFLMCPHDIESGQIRA